MDSENRVLNQSLAEPRSESKVLLGQKRDITEAEETSDTSYKRLNLHYADSLCPSKAQAGVLDLNVNADPISIPVGVDAPAHNVGFNKEKNRGFDLDLNAEDTSSSINNDPFYPFKNYEHLKSRDDSECGSSVGPLEDRDPLRVWKGLKENNYMTGRYGAAPMSIPKTRGRKKNNNDVTKKKTELAKKEHVDRFAKVAAPSGLLNGLNPGIINHVRNRKQVHSIIEALVRSRNTESQKNNGTGDYGLSTESNYLNSEVPREHGDSFVRVMGIFERMPSKMKIKNDDALALKLSSSVASENTSCLSNEESGNLTSVNSLSLKAANVASQWLELLSQDIRGRLAALRRSKKRVRTVITTELPHLISREFSSHLHDKAAADAHAVRWRALFGQMDITLSEEEINLENWLNQVKEMQLHCERGLYDSLQSASQEMGPLGNNNRLEGAHNSEKDLAVRAAAASIYSTCNFLLTMENLPTCQLSKQ